MAILYVWSGAAGSGSGADWTNAKTTLTAAFTTEAAGDTLYVAHDHAEATAGALSLTSSGTITNITKVICVDRGGTVPPVSADRRATAQVTATGNNNITITGCTHYDGIIFIAGNSTGVASLLAISGNAQWIRYDNCSLRLGSSGATSVIQFGASSATGNCVELNNTTLSFSHANQTAQVRGVVRWRNTASAVIGAAVPGALLTPIALSGGDVECIGVDFSALGSGKVLVDNINTTYSRNFRFIDCKLHASVTKQTAVSAHGAIISDFVRAGASGVNYAVHSQRIGGTLTEELTIIRTGGASDGTTGLSWKVVTTAYAFYSTPFECPPIAIWNDTTGSAVTATVEGIAATLPTDAECWLEVEYLGDASSPQGSFVNDGKADLIVAAANQTSSSETWGGSTAAFKLSCTFTAQQAGWIYCRIKCAKPSSVFYLDPLVVLS